MLTDRPARSIDDLRAAADLLSRAWAAGAPHVAATPAALDWWYVVSHPDPLEAHLRLWEQDGRAVAWSWHDEGEVEIHVWSADGAAADAAILRTILDRAVEEAAPGSLGAFSAEDDAATLATLRDLGFAPAGRRLSQWQRHDAPAPGGGTTALPSGYRIRGLAGPEEFEARVAVHRAAFPTSRLTTVKYARMLDLPHYRLEDDLVVEAPDGTLAAYAMTWWDEAGLVGEFEPVGTHPDHQRLGLARALLEEGSRRLSARGARTIQVYSDADAAPAERLYAAAGFRRRARHQRYEHPGRGSGGVRSAP